MQALGDLGEADGEPGQRVAPLRGCDPPPDAHVGAVGALEAGVDGDAGGARDGSDTREIVDRLTVEGAAPDEPVGERRGAQQQATVAPELALEASELGEHGGRLEQRRRGEAARRDDASAEAAAAEASAQALDLLLEDPESCGADRQGRVLGQLGRNVEVIGDSLELGMDDAPALRAPGRLDVECPLDSLAEGGRVRDAGDRGDPLGKVDRVVELEPAEPLFELSVLEERSYVQPEHVLAAALDHELDRFEHTGANRPIRDHERLRIKHAPLEAIGIGGESRRSVGMPSRNEPVQVVEFPLG